MNLSPLVKGWATGLCMIMAAGVIACVSKTPVANRPMGMTDEQFALDRLEKMSLALGSARHLYIFTSETHEWKDDAGSPQKVTGTEEIFISRPDAMKITSKAEGDHEMDSVIYFSDSMLAFEGHKKKIWAQVPTYPFIDEMLDDAAARFDLPIPVSDFLYGSPYDSLIYEDTKAKWLDRVQINGDLCDHFSFSDSQLKWEIWISAGEPALPRQIEIVKTSMAGTPRSVITFNRISFDRILPDDGFRLIPKTDYMEIEVTENKPE